MNRFRLIALACLLGLAGCFSVERTKLPDTGDEHIVMWNSGWYLFNCVALCGNATEDASFPLVIGRDDVTLEKTQARFLAECARKGKTATNLQWACYEDVTFKISLFGADIPIPYILGSRELQLSGVLK